MRTTRYVLWQDGEMWLGYLEDYPDYLTQGETMFCDGGVGKNDANKAIP